MSAALKLANPRRIKAAHRRRWKCSTGHRVYASDNPYRYTDPFGLYTCSGNKDQCATVQTALKDITKAAANLKAGSAEQTHLNAVVKMFGNEGEKNGVSVAFGTAKDANATTDTKGTSVTITLNLETMNRPGFPGGCLV